jgi:hypothetical protein
MFQDLIFKQVGAKFASALRKLEQEKGVNFKFTLQNAVFLSHTNEEVKDVVLSIWQHHQGKDYCVSEMPASEYIDVALQNDKLVRQAVEMLNIDLGEVLSSFFADMEKERGANVFLLLTHQAVEGKKNKASILNFVADNAIFKRIRL